MINLNNAAEIFAIQTSREKIEQLKILVTQVTDLTKDSQNLITFAIVNDMLVKPVGTIQINYFANKYHNKTERNHNETFNNQPFNLLCKNHRRHGDRTFECDQPDTCKMAGITVQRQPKNELPSPGQ